MSPSSRESELSQLREALAQSNSELLLTISDRRKLCLRIQGLKEKLTSYSHYVPEQEKKVFEQFASQMKDLTMKELLAFSLIMEDQAQALAPGSYPNWSARIHLSAAEPDLYEMINPLLLKKTHQEIFNRLKLQPDFSFLKDF
jgi:chorismate mutase